MNRSELDRFVAENGTEIPVTTAQQEICKHIINETEYLQYLRRNKGEFI